MIKSSGKFKKIIIVAMAMSIVSGIVISEGVPEISASNTNLFPKFSEEDTKIFYTDDSFDPMTGVRAPINPDIYSLRCSVKGAALQRNSYIMPITTSDSASSAYPVITGAEDVTINVDDAFSMFYGVRAVDKDGTDLTRSIKFTGSVSSTNPGVYPVSYSVTDKDGLTTTVTRIITVQ